MANDKTHYDYQHFDKLLTEDLDPTRLGNLLDEIMSDLVNYASNNEDYPVKHLVWHYYILRTLRDLFWKLEKIKP